MITVLLTYLTKLGILIISIFFAGYCALDDNKIWTFSGRSYEYTITSSWHVVMVDDSEDLGKGLVILARRPSANQEEVYVSYQ